MSSIRFFHEIYGNVHELPDGGTFPYERGLQEFFEKHLRTLTGIDFLDSEHSTGQLHSRRIDTLGIDEAGRPVVIEYKRRQDENVINQGLDYLAWLEDHQAEFRELVRGRFGDGRVAGIDFGTPRLLCIAADFLRQDQIAAQNSRRRVDLLRYRRYGDAYVALEWVYGAESVEPPPRPVVFPRRAAGNEQTAVAPHPVQPPARGGDEVLDFSRYPRWEKANEATRLLFRKLETLVRSLGRVQTAVSKSQISFKCLDSPGHEKVITYIIDMYSRSVGIRLIVSEKHVRDIPPDASFTRPHDNGKYREFIIRGDEDIRRAEPLVRAAYDSLAKHGDSPARPAAARKAWATRRRSESNDHAESPPAGDRGRR